MRKEIIKYDDQFKRTVISMLENGEVKSIEEARRVFNIRGSSSISKWIKRMGREDLLPIIKMRRIRDEAEEIYQKKWTVVPVQNWTVALSHLSIIFEERLKDVL